MIIHLVIAIWLNVMPIHAVFVRLLIFVMDPYFYFLIVLVFIDFILFTLVDFHDFILIEH